MKIAIDCRYIGKSGIGKFIENVVNWMLPNHPENNYLLIVNRDTHLKESGSVRLLKTSYKPFSLRELLVFPVKQINKCDAYFTPYINIPVGIEIPVYTTIHDMLFFDVEGLVSSIGKVVRKWFYKRAVKKSRRIFTVSEFSKQRIHHHFNTEKDIVVVSNGISRYIKEYPIEKCIEKENYYIYVGNVKPHKGLKTLITAFAEARKEGLKSKLLIVGNAEKFRTVDKTIYNLVADEDSISFTGWVSDEELTKYISRAKALILPSLYEGFGIPPMEAIYLGTSAIVSDIPVLKEIYQDLPVTFFQVGNHEDLKNKLLGISNTIESIDNIRRVIDGKYSFAHSADVILSVISNDLGL